MAAGIFFNSYKFDFKSVGTIGSIYVNLVRMPVIPLVVVLVINSITTLTNLGHLRKIGFKTISIFLRPVSPR
ncbi:cation:dicarboxylate symporter family transporter [Paenibacillus sp.]|uniref:cation:dicarboxylate symporter family transporter n=1 Tax=Paenibacillus sp. TaxID=58172 RepID=UPI00356AE162